VPVIFATAYDAYALKAFKVNSVDYLLKPIVPEELKKAIDKFKNIHGAQTDKSALEAVIKQFQPQTKERFLIKIGEHYKSVSTSDIRCFYIMERSLFILTNTGKNYPVDYSLDNIEQSVDSKAFFRINRNIIINFNFIEDVIAYSSSRLKIILTGWKEKEDIIVSRERVAAFKEWMDR
jgi:DNA-binding LytR/AlgR family response regulator